MNICRDTHSESQKGYQRFDVNICRDTHSETQKKYQRFDGIYVETRIVSHKRDTRDLT